MKFFLVYCSVILKALLVTAIVETPLGRIQGYHRRSFNGRKFAAFEGIPYAKPPIGQLRFREPVPIDPWTGVWNASLAIECMQTALFNVTGIYGQEDCLYINVFVPREVPNPDEKLDVIVHIHGGAFMWDSGHSYAQPQYVMDRDVIFVTFNYRLGILGFLSTNDDLIPGNNGLKDQVLALKWVQQNIQSFGGNPDSVTITGLSAGAACVQLHYLSPLSKGLFHRGFSQSGVALNSWVLQEEPLQRAQTVAANLGCPTDNNEKMIECLRERPAKHIVNTIGLFFSYKFMPVCPFAPVIENSGSNSFLDDSPYNLLNQGKINDVPWMMSTVEHDGLLPAEFMKDDFDMINSNWVSFAPSLLEFNYTLPLNISDITIRKVKKYYFGNKDISNETFSELIEMLGDRIINSDSAKAVKLHSKASKSDVYYYHFSYSYEANPLKTVSHADDGNYFFYQMYPWELSENDVKMKDLLYDMLISFAKTGKPTIKDVTWEPMNHSGEQLIYVNISGFEPEQIKPNTKTELFSEKFWSSLGLLENENLIVHKD